ncbi:MAG: hypothetical protein NCW75_04110 [Phycisphaera sp.]|nr:MAG: hypothetical protein NCW75_04110 [Phycisphaera sp.]
MTSNVSKYPEIVLVSSEADAVEILPFYCAEWHYIPTPLQPGQPEIYGVSVLLELAGRGTGRFDLSDHEVQQRLLENAEFELIDPSKTVIPNEYSINWDNDLRHEAWHEPPWLVLRSGVFTCVVHRVTDTEEFHVVLTDVPEADRDHEHPEQASRRVSDMLFALKLLHEF